MKTFSKWMDKLTDWAEISAMNLMVIAIFLQVVCRYVFNHALPWPEEIGRYLFCWGTYLAVCISMRGDQNLRIELLLNALGPKPRKMLNMFVSSVNVMFFALLTWLTWDITFQVRELGELMASMPVPVWFVWAGLPVCFALITLQAVKNLYLIAIGRIGYKQAA